MTTTLDRKHFFDTVRSDLHFGRLTQEQVDTYEILLSEWEREYGDEPLEQLAYILATTFHETGATIQPLKEWGRGRGKEYGKVDHTGKAPYGRGFVQLTWNFNYKNAANKLNIPELATNYDVALDPRIATKILFRGMKEGWFTSRRLDQYITGTKKDYRNARRIVNGLDKASKIAKYAEKYEKALVRNDEQ